jgi:hypothetical protein
MHLKAQGIKFSERTADSLEIPPFSKGCVKTSKVMMDLMKVRYGYHYYCDNGGDSDDDNCNGNVFDIIISANTVLYMPEGLQVCSFLIG